MAKDSKPPAGKDVYSDVVARLEAIVETLEGGELSLEDSLEKFAEGVALVKKGEKLLADAEKRIEALMSDQGATEPLDAEAPVKSKKGGRGGEEDVPF